MKCDMRLATCDMPSPVLKSNQKSKFICDNSFTPGRKRAVNRKSQLANRISQITCRGEVSFGICTRGPTILRDVGMSCYTSKTYTTTAISLKQLVCHSNMVPLETHSNDQVGIHVAVCLFLG